MTREAERMLYYLNMQINSAQQALKEYEETGVRDDFWEGYQQGITSASRWAIDRLKEIMEEDEL